MKMDSDPRNAKSVVQKLTLPCFEAVENGASMNFNKLTVSTRLSAAFGFLAVVLILASMLSLKDLNDASDRFGHFVSGINGRANG